MRTLVHSRCSLKTKKKVEKSPNLVLNCILGENYSIGYSIWLVWAFFGMLGWPWFLEIVTFAFKILKATNGCSYAKVTSWSVWKRMYKLIENFVQKKEILSKNLKMSQFNASILEKPEFFSRQNLYQENGRSLKFHLLFENLKRTVRIKRYSSKKKDRIPNGIHKSGWVKSRVFFLYFFIFSRLIN